MAAAPPRRLTRPRAALTRPSPPSGAAHHKRRPVSTRPAACSRTCLSLPPRVGSEAEDLGVVRVAGGVAHGADPDGPGLAVQDVGAVAGALHPGVDDLRGGAVAPGDVLAGRAG